MSAGPASAAGVATRARALAVALRWIGAAGIAGIAAVRCVIVFAPQVVFDVDPSIAYVAQLDGTMDPALLPGLGPAGSLLLDALLLAACGCALLGETLTRRGLEWPLLALALVPVPAVAWHGLSDAGDLWRGATWLAAAVACVTAAHLGRDRALRLAMVSLLAAVLVPVLLRGALQSELRLGAWTLVGPEHRATIAEFERHRDEYFRERGWAHGSASARIYEERLRQADPRGWFPTTNIFASMTAWGLVLCAGLGAGAVRDRLGARWVAALAVGAAASGAGLAASGSKGAALAAAAGLVMLAAPWWARGKLGPILARRGWALALGLVVAAAAAIALRGLIGEWWGERSLLFRWHYLCGAATIVLRHGLLGVGPDGFQAAYVEARPLRSPEEVMSAHNVGADWLADLGAAGLAWTALVALMVWRAGARAQGAEAGGGYVPGRRVLLAAAAVALAGLAPAVLVEYAVVDSPAKEVCRLAGIVGFVAAAAVLAGALERSRQARADWTLAAGAVVLVVHAQIEMTFFDPGSVVWMMSVVGLAGGARLRALPPGRALAGAGAAALLLAAAAYLSLAGAARTARAEALAVEAARLIVNARGSEPQAWARQEAADLLETAWREHMPSDTALLELSARQLLIAAELSREAERLRLADDAIERAGRAADAGGKPSATALLADAWALKASLTGAEADWREAVGAARRRVALDPNGIASWRKLGDVLWAAGHAASAAPAYEQALRNDANFALDPMRQLAPDERRTIEERIAAAHGSGRGLSPKGSVPP
jgi:hypothetical protein